MGLRPGSGSKFNVFGSTTLVCRKYNHGCVIVDSQYTCILFWALSWLYTNIPFLVTAEQISPPYNVHIVGCTDFLENKNWALVVRYCFRTPIPKSQISCCFLTWRRASKNQGWAPCSFPFWKHRSFPFLTHRSFPFFYVFFWVFGDLWTQKNDAFFCVLFLRT